jgi:hypothetical protein
MLGVEGPNVEILDAVLPVQIVQGRALAQRPAQQPARIASCTLRVPSEQSGFNFSRENSEPDEIGHLNPRQRACVCRHTKMLSRGGTARFLGYTVTIHPLIKEPR